MFLFSTTNFTKNAAIITVAVLLFVSLWLGLSSGKNKAQLAYVTATSEVLDRGLGYFYEDQDRFPTAAEFGNPEVMLQYFTAYPFAQLKSETCSESFIYRRVSQTNFALDICVPTSGNNFRKGWNVLERVR